MFQIILCVVLFILVYLMFITWILHISPTTSTIDGIEVCTWYKTSGVYMVQDMSKQIYVPPLKDTASPKTAMCWLEKTIRHTTCDLLFVQSKCEWYPKHDSNHTIAVLIIICVFMKSRTANRRPSQIRRSRTTASYFYTTVGWTLSIKTAHIIQYVRTSIHVNIL